MKITSISTMSNLETSLITVVYNDGEGAIRSVTITDEHASWNDAVALVYEFEAGIISSFETIVEFLKILEMPEVYIDEPVVEDWWVDEGLDEMLMEGALADESCDCEDFDGPLFTVYNGAMPEFETNTNLPFLAIVDNSNGTVLMDDGVLERVIRSNEVLFQNDLKNKVRSDMDKGYEEYSYEVEGLGMTTIRVPLSDEDEEIMRHG